MYLSTEQVDKTKRGHKNQPVVVGAKRYHILWRLSTPDSYTLWLVGSPHTVIRLAYDTDNILQDTAILAYSVALYDITDHMPDAVYEDIKAICDRTMKGYGYE